LPQVFYVLVHVQIQAKELTETPTQMRAVSLQ